MIFGISIQYPWLLLDPALIIEIKKCIVIGLEYMYQIYRLSDDIWYKYSGSLASPRSGPDYRNQKMDRLGLEYVYQICRLLDDIWYKYPGSLATPRTGPGYKNQKMYSNQS